MAMNTATYDDAADCGRDECGARALGRAGNDCREGGRRGDRDERDDRAAGPATEHDLPRGCRREPREVKCAGAHLGTEHGVADDERRDRHDEPEDAVGRNRCEGALSGFVDGVREKPEQERAGTRYEHRQPPLRGKHDCNV